MINKPKCFILDVDGVMTSGEFFYTQEGKYLKCFGPDDNDGLSLLKPFIDIRFITGDKKGFDISKKRIVDDMNYKLDLVSTIKRIDWISSLYSTEISSSRMSHSMHCCSTISMMFSRTAIIMSSSSAGSTFEMTGNVTMCVFAFSGNSMIAPEVEVMCIL